jgi:hypothetical protein
VPEDNNTIEDQASKQTNDNEQLHSRKQQRTSNHGTGNSSDQQQQQPWHEPKENPSSEFTINY